MTPRSVMNWSGWRIGFGPTLKFTIRIFEVLCVEDTHLGFLEGRFDLCLKRLPCGITRDVSPPNLPRNWQEIAPGHLVIAHESNEDGWWEAIVLECDGDMLTLRWRDYPKQPKVVRHRAAVALISTGI